MSTDVSKLNDASKVNDAPRRWPTLGEVLGDIDSVIRSSASIACLAHKDADADSLGSALAFALALRATGKQVHVLVPSPRPMLIAYLPGFDSVEEVAPPIDALFTFDCATVGRFGDKRALIGATPIVVNVDHHASNDAFGSINLVEPTASATGQVVHGLLRALDIPIPAAAATNLYAALLTDTGGFRHDNTTEAALRLGADLVKLGADAAWVAAKNYKSRSVGQLRLEALAVAQLRSELDGTLIWSTVTAAMLEDSATAMQESEGIIDQLQSVATMRLAVLIKETEPGLTKVSVRSRAPVDATAVCRPFGGGGHVRAAGAEIAEPIEIATPRVLAVARALLAAQ